MDRFGREKKGGTRYKAGSGGTALCFPTSSSVCSLAHFQNLSLI